MFVKWGEIYYCNLGEGIGSEQGGIRPVLIIQNDIGNKYSPTTQIAPITTAATKATIPTHYWLREGCGLPKNSMVLFEQTRCIDKQRLRERVGQISENEAMIIKKKIKIEFQLS